VPFQVVNTSKKLPRFKVTLISAGPDQLIFCGDTVYLQAIVDNPTLLDGHTMLWEQLEGPPVPLATPHQIATSYPFVETTDKKFRFWLDKGTLVEQYADMEVWHTPKSVVHTTSLGHEVVVWGVPSDPIPCDTFNAIIDTIIPPVDGNHYDSVPVTFNVLITWDIPAYVDGQPFITQYIVYENGSPVATIPVSEPREYIGGLNTYSILTEYNIRQQYSSAMSCEKDFSGLIIPSLHVVDDTLGKLPLGSETNITTRYSNIKTGTESIMNLTNLGTPWGSTIRYSNIKTGTESIMNLTNLGASWGSSTRFDPGGIGG
jgi:hypothetical protein